MNAKSENNLHGTDRTTLPHEAASRHDAGRGHDAPEGSPLTEMIRLWNRTTLQERMKFLAWVQDRPNQYGDAERSGGRKAMVGELREQIHQREHKAHTA